MSDTIRTDDIASLNDQIEKMQKQIKPLETIISSAKELGRDVSLLESNMRVIKSMMDSLIAERDYLIKNKA